jgi:hypothetical protein
MAIYDCDVCRQLIEEGELSIKAHLDAKADQMAIMHKDHEEGALISLEEKIRACRRRREEAIAAYHNHLSEHTLKTVTDRSTRES